MIYRSRWQRQVEHNKQWHDWFAWYPIVVRVNGQWRKVWLQTVRRRWVFVPMMIGYSTEYRIKK